MVSGESSRKQDLHVGMYLMAQEAGAHIHIDTHTQKYMHTA
jgi:hypothetical protein